MAKKPALGKGLSALISERSVTDLSNGFMPNLPIDLIKANPYQPRSEIDPSTLTEMADSIRQHGIIEPLLVTKDGKEYILIAGERRLRASKLAGLKAVPVVIRESSPQEMLELAIIENIQRKDLNPLEEAMAFQQLAESYSMTHEKIAEKMGLSRPAVANKIRLLSLPEDLRKGLLENKISEGHARALLGLKSEDTMMATYKVILRDHLSVRAVEELVRRLNKGQMKNKKKTNRVLDDETIQLENNLKSKFGKEVVLSRSQKGGKIIIPFGSEDDLKRIVEELL